MTASSQSVSVFSFLCCVSYSYLDVRCVSLAVPPCSGHGGEGAVGVVKLPSLEVEEECGEGLLSIRYRCCQYLLMSNVFSVPATLCQNTVLLL